MSETSLPSTTRSYWIHALSPLHVGAGRGIGFIDLPLVRESLTGFPYVPGSAVKGVMADHHNATDEARKSGIVGQAFGSGGETSNSGSIVFMDARLVCLPVRSVYGTFAWCTSPIVLQRLQRDLGKENASFQKMPLPRNGDVSQIGVPEPSPRESTDTLPAERSVLVGNARSETSTRPVYFEDLDFVVNRHLALLAPGGYLVIEMFDETE